MKRILRSGLPLSLLAILAAQPVGAYDYPLSSESIRQAYFLGSGDPDKRTLFFEKYTKRYPVPQSGVYVGLIEFETPYVQIAARIAQKVSSYHAPDAVEEFLGKPATCRVRVEVYWGYNNAAAIAGRGNYGPLDYTVRLKQKDKEIPLKSKWSQTLVAGYSAPIDVGIEFDNEYDADNVESAPATVEVVGPDGKTLTETFDLDGLR
jgi:hypothetical protein